jgi:hypothetical protein
MTNILAPGLIGIKSAVRNAVAEVNGAFNFSVSQAAS